MSEIKTCYDYKILFPIFRDILFMKNNE